MERYTRLVYRKSRPEKRPIEPPFSNFGFVEKEFSGVRSLRRIMSQVRQHGGKTMVIEELSPGDADDVREENEDIATYIGTSQLPDSRVRRISFFKKAPSEIGKIAEVSNDDFIGYVIVKEDKVPTRKEPVSRIFESVIRPNVHTSNFIHRTQKWQCDIDGGRFNINGYLYAQQNYMTNVCAHVACRTVAAGFHKDGDMSYREMNQAICIDHRDDRKIVDGLNVVQMETILQAAGARCIRANYIPSPPFDQPSYQKFLYGSIESGYPAIIIFATADMIDGKSQEGPHHAVPVFGHTFNEDTWVPGAELSYFPYFRVGNDTKYIPSESWLNTFLAHDDNLGSNFCIPRDFLYTRRRCKNNKPSGAFCDTQDECVVHVLATVPKDVKADPIDAELVGLGFLESIISSATTYLAAEPWGKRLISFSKDHQLVLRTVLITGEKYFDHLAQMSDWSGKRIKNTLIDKLNVGLKPEENIWMVEISMPELFSANHRKVGEILIRASIPIGKNLAGKFAWNFNQFVMARLPRCFVTYVKGEGTDGGYKPHPNNIRDHVALWGCK